VSIARDRKVKLQSMALLGVLAIASAVLAAEWHEYKSEKYGFSMKVPPGTEFTEKEAHDGWGFLHAQAEGGPEFFALAKLGEQAKPEEIEAVGVALSGIDAKHWKQIDKGEKKNGWTWWQTHEASDGHNLVFAGYGTGAKGSYLCFLKTTEADYKEHKAKYKEWYESVQLH
jgi:hypothetical protein